MEIPHLVPVQAPKGPSHGHYLCHLWVSFQEGFPKLSITYLEPDQYYTEWNLLALGCLHIETAKEGVDRTPGDVGFRFSGVFEPDITMGESKDG